MVLLLLLYSVFSFVIFWLKDMRRFVMSWVYKAATHVAIPTNRTHVLSSLLNFFSVFFFTLLNNEIIWIPLQTFMRALLIIRLGICMFCVFNCCCFNYVSQFPQHLSYQLLFFKLRTAANRRNYRGEITLRMNIYI